MRRSLVLTREHARHPFRVSLPHRRESFADLPQGFDTSWRLTAADVRGVATTYFATVAAALAFII
ncbi:hypothetical protein [Qipengyuania marisflavi]|uniref:Uncharacterized protein n=1 Tax=Qipengyuania marisflavi TaxID=2486356 RepID=A0A5S3P7D2_9SPHN|nr:hypothetical protein [Qipengyuania marisflavi]TMM49067.1 hypothetical protein FEV51_06790 [Qipengyuania marisflavi]